MGQYEKVENVLAQAKETHDEQNGTKSDLVRDLLKGNEEAYPLVGLPQKASIEIFGVKSPVTPKSGTTEDLKNKAQDLGSDGAKKTKTTGKLKKVAREIGKRQIANKEAQVNIGGKKRAGFIESLEKVKAELRREFVKHISLMTKKQLRYRRRLLHSTAGSNVRPWLELLGAWEPPVSEGAAQVSAVVGSQHRLFNGDEAK